MTETKKLPQYAAGLAAAGGAFCVGTAIGWSSPAAPRLLDEVQYFPISSSQWSWIASILTLGCAISCIPIGYLMNKFGRKWTMMGLVVPFIIGWCLIIWAQNFIMMLIGRFLLGLAGGAFCISAPQYSAEIAEKEIRGALASFFQLLIALGILFAYVVGAYFTVFTMNIILGLCPIIFGLIFFFMPESPFYYVTKDRKSDAVNSLIWLRGSSYDSTMEVNEMREQFAQELQAKVSFSTAIKERASKSALVLGIGLLYIQHMSAITAILFYATTIFSVRNFNLNFIIKLNKLL
jgi:SP family facilitated glucose transporter-like MFS transporter 8